MPMSAPSPYATPVPNPPLDAYPNPPSAGATGAKPRRGRNRRLVANNAASGRASLSSSASRPPPAAASPDALQPSDTVTAHSATQSSWSPTDMAPSPPPHRNLPSAVSGGLPIPMPTGAKMWQSAAVMEDNGEDDAHISLSPRKMGLSVGFPSSSSSASAWISETPLFALERHRKENERLRELNRQEREMFALEMRHLKNKLNKYRSTNVQLQNDLKATQTLLSESKKDKSLLLQKYQLLQDQMSSFKAQVEHSYAEKKADLERVHHLEDCLAKLRDDHQVALTESQARSVKVATLEKELSLAQHRIEKMSSSTLRVDKKRDEGGKTPNRRLSKTGSRLSLARSMHSVHGLQRPGQVSGQPRRATGPRAATIAPGFPTSTAMSMTQISPLALNSTHHPSEAGLLTTLQAQLQSETLPLIEADGHTQGRDDESVMDSEAELESLQMLQEAYAEIATLRHQNEHIKKQNAELQAACSENLLMKELEDVKERYQSLQEALRLGTAGEAATSPTPLSDDQSRKPAKEREGRRSTQLALTGPPPTAADSAPPGRSSHEALFWKFLQELFRVPYHLPYSPTRMDKQRAVYRRVVKSLRSSLRSDPQMWQPAWRDLLQVLGNEKGVRLLRRHLARLRLEKRHMRMRILRLRVKITDVASRYRSHCRALENQVKVKQLEKEDQVDALEHKLKEIVTDLETRAGAHTGLATIHNFFNEQLNAIEATADADRDDLSRIKDLGRNLQIALPDASTATIGIVARRVVDETVDLLQARIAEKQARVAQIKAGLLNVEKDLRVLDKRAREEFQKKLKEFEEAQARRGGGAEEGGVEGAVNMPALSPVQRIPYVSMIEGPDSSEQDVQTDEAGIVSQRLLFQDEKIFNETVPAEVVIYAIREEDILIRVMMADLDWPLFLYAIFDSITFPKDKSLDESAISDSAALESSSAQRLATAVAKHEEADEDDITSQTEERGGKHQTIDESMASKLVELIDIEYVRGFPHLVLLGQEDPDAAKHDPQPRPALDVDCLYNDERVFTFCVNIGGIPWLSSLLQCKRTRHGMVFYHLCLYLPVTGWCRYASMASRHLCRYLGLNKPSEFQRLVDEWRRNPSLLQPTADEQIHVPMFVLGDLVVPPAGATGLAGGGGGSVSSFSRSPTAYALTSSGRHSVEDENTAMLRKLLAVFGQVFHQELVGRDIREETLDSLPDWHFEEIIIKGRLNSQDRLGFVEELNSSAEKSKLIEDKKARKQRRSFLKAKQKGKEEPEAALQAAAAAAAAAGGAEGEAPQAAPQITEGDITFLQAVLRIAPDGYVTVSWAPDNRADTVIIEDTGDQTDSGGEAAGAGDTTFQRQRTVRVSLPAAEHDASADRSQEGESSGAEDGGGASSSGSSDEREGGGEGEAEGEGEADMSLTGPDGVDSST
ncbi:unnamed protein product [Vitrella brassicaformis CCMP3155]|uniref:Uncharacterized protein n=4 Tax=Vitrella brassicaformis TaxID=1169539 RepID=A0A0G4EAZ4_VITBC|nr:unnamed protein product [Vitrella brassicaformis CCMP3155]|eukprot:CEL92459.1 unnamed protein product [Vitrella brassicaformis CCMP3155]